jgi:hypothetical protein
MLHISEKIKALPKKDLRKWIKANESRDSQDWKDELAKLKKRLDAKGTSTKGKDD